MSVNTVSKIDNIKYLYSLVNIKKDAIEAVALATGRSYLGIKNNWLSGGFSVPEDFQDIVITVLQNVIKNQ